MALVNDRSDGRRYHRVNDEAMLEELERLKEEYLQREREEEEKEKELAAIEKYVVGVKYVEMNIGDNIEEHNTGYFYDGTPRSSIILRRGQPTDIDIRFNRQYDLTQDLIVLEFVFGSNPRFDKGTFIRLPITDNKSFTLPATEWDIRLREEGSDFTKFQVQISCVAAIGAWKLKVVSSNPNGPKPKEFHVTKIIYILFNPWCKDDAVYMEDEAKRWEYVVTQTGKLFIGTHDNPSSRKWVYGQFSDIALTASMAILEKSPLDDIGRRSPIKVARAISAMINSYDNNGIIEGKWRQPYYGGTEPYKWTGSYEILKTYLRNGFKPVKYGQCWVFAGLFTTVSRALGIPCRPVTTYKSAHDADDTLTIDLHFTADGKKLENDDSVWNFHVWNDCWMTRPDLPPGYGGWQAVDSTPQERSEGIYQMGPASVYAVKMGNIGYLYDTPFVFSEVNADVVHWQRDLTERIGWKRTKREIDTVGPLIVTRNPNVYDPFGDRDMENITEQYKSQERSAEERLAVRNAATHEHYAPYFDVPPPWAGDVFFELLTIDKVMIGLPFDVILCFSNGTDESRKVTAAYTIDSVYYTGIKSHTIKHEVKRIILEPRQREQWTMTVTFDEYYDKLVEYSMMKIYAVATVKQTKQTWTEAGDFVLEKPRLMLEVPQPLHVGEEFKLSIILKNPLPRSLLQCSFVVEGPGLAKPYRSNHRDIYPEETIVHKLSFVPKRAGKRNVLVIFNSEQLIDVQGSLDVEVISSQ